MRERIHRRWFLFDDLQGQTQQATGHAKQGTTTTTTTT
jgi:hypothetical protein